MWDELHGFSNQLCPEFCSWRPELMPEIKGDSRWVKCAIFLPEDYREVLYFAVNEGGSKEIMTGHRENGNWTHCCLWYSTMTLPPSTKVTHWMPLPEYPDLEE